MANVRQLSFEFSNGKEETLNLLDKPRSLEAFANGSYSPFTNHSINNYITSNSTVNGHGVSEPLADNLVCGKNSYAYDAHTYHTKVPPEAIERLIEYYTQPGEFVLDPFCGSGMMGLAALKSHRKPILVDLSPAATFIASNFLTPVDSKEYFVAIRKILAFAYKKELELYGTHCRKCGRLVPIEYTVWSYGLLCQYCHNEFILWDVARDEKKNVRESKIKTEFDCPKCGEHLSKRTLRRTKLFPVQIGYRCCESGLKETTVFPDEYDLNVLLAMDKATIPSELWFPAIQLPAGVNTRQAILHGIDSIDALYTKRNLHAVALLWDIARRWLDPEISRKLMFTVTSLYQRVTRLSEFRFWGGSGNIANYNVPMIFNEQNVFKVFYRKARTIQLYLETWKDKPETAFYISTQSATNLSNIPDDSIDYIFTDPPFGSNINYSEMNFIWEAWLGVFTDTKDEAIVNAVQSKTIDEYRELMTKALLEMYRVLKPSKWLSLVFHNSSAKVWAAIQQAITSSGFSLERIQTLDKQHGTFKQFVSENAVGYDLIIHCRKRTATGIMRLNTKHETTRSSIQEFVKTALSDNIDNFIVRYLHVNRQNEFDARKLYSMWLKEVIESGKTIDMSFDEFRKVIIPIIRMNFPDLQMVEAEVNLI